MAQPNAFTNQLEKWIYQKYIGSIVFVEFRSKKPAEVLGLWNRIAPITGKVAAKKEELEKREADLEFGLYCTGFIVKIEVARILILTCAHALGHAFSLTELMTREQVQQYFQPIIICDHHAQARGEIQARVERISCGMDMILLSVPRNAFQAYCPQVHTPIPMAPSFPEALEKVVMLSWPPLNHRTAVSGEIAHPLRAYGHLSSTNPKGYNCRLAQVRIASEAGSSGAPLINGAGEFLCTLHGGFGGPFSYFVCYEDLRNTLIAWDVLEG